MSTYVTKEIEAALSKHVLSIVLEQPGIIVFRLGPDRQTGMEVTRLIFTREPLAEQIIITGDLHPGNGNGVISNAGYGLAWFAGRTSEGYLCEKFLRQEYVPASARRSLEGLKADHESGELELTAEQLETLEQALEDSVEPDDGDGGNPVRSHEAFYDLWYDLYGTSPDERGFDYHPSTAGWLCAIQQRFAALYPALEAERRAA